MKIIDFELLNSLSLKAKGSTRLRKNLNFHNSDDDLLQRMLNAFEPYSYVQPHRHLKPAKREVFLILRGKLLVVVFDDTGGVKKYTVLDPIKGVFAVEIPVGQWHFVTSLETGTVVYEIKDGPYCAVDDKEFANWAPGENDIEAARLYLKQLLELIN
ncbi:MAG: WbuC family cupin fold metalloprotein [Marinilabiliaceae bacterium]|nr:WbuC family cupin fold metalloprotein [Marinilabiliaceae bacterium]